MGCVAENCRMYCTVSDTPFGPLCESDEECQELIRECNRTQGYDPRALSREQQETVLAALRDGTVKTWPTHKRKQCGCGSGEYAARVYWQYGKTWTKCSKHEAHVEAPEYGAL